MNLAIPLLHHPEIHGDVNEPFLGHYLSFMTITNDEFFNEYSDVKELLNFIKKNMKTDDKNNKHPIRNYWKIVRDPKIELVETHTLRTGEEVCIIKTHLIKIIQRRWRKYLKSKNE